MINLTIQSQNFKDVSIVDITTFQEINTTVNNISTEIPYSNYLLKIQSSTSSFTFNNFWSNITDIQKDTILIFITLLIIIIIMLATKFMRKL
jgi:hypothetical protein